MLRYFLLFLISVPGLCIDVDSLFRNLSARALSGDDLVVNLHAQFKDPNKDTTNTNAFDQFFLLSVIDNITHLVNFDENYNFIKKSSSKEPWIGVSGYYPWELKNLELFQLGYINLTTCLAKQGVAIENYPLKRLTIYKNLRDQNIIYDFVAKIDDQPLCQEFLYSPATQECDLGMQVQCRVTL